MSLRCGSPRLRSPLRLHALFLVLIVSISAFDLTWADPLTRPFWTEQAMFQFGDDVFFVGRASCAKTSEEGRQRAFTQGMQELFNYAQGRHANGVHVDTQMVFEEAGSSGCPTGTVTVWRLLRVDAAQLEQAAKSSPRRATVGEDRSPATLRPSIGMSRDEVFDRFGLPASITVRQGNRFTWEYRKFGLTVEFDRHLFVIRWTIDGPHAGHQGYRETLAHGPAQPLAIQTIR